MIIDNFKIMNVMLSRKLGGIEQAFLNYNQALHQNNCHILNVVSIKAAINNFLDLDSQISHILNLNKYDIISILQLKKLLHKYKPHVIVAHGNRAIQLCYYAKTSHIPLIGVAHNYNIKLLKKCDHVISLTNHIQNHLIESNIATNNISLVPNMIDIKLTKSVARHKPIVIGAMGRFVSKKGFDIFLQALSTLKLQGIEFKAIIAGDGEEKKKLNDSATKLDLEDQVTFIGWVENKQKFFDAIDIFCLPSIHEPFGIILLESMMYKKPIVSFATEGPSEIVTNQQDALLCEIGSYQALAHNLNILINDETYAQKLAQNAHLRVIENYAIDTIGKKLYHVLEKIYNDFQVNNSR